MGGRTNQVAHKCLDENSKSSYLQKDRRAMSPKRTLVKVPCAINNFKPACQRLTSLLGSKSNRHPTGPSISRSQTRRMKGATEEEKLCMTELSGRRWHGQTWHVQIEQPRGIQPIIMWSPRHLKWKILATHD